MESHSISVFSVSENKRQGHTVRIIATLMIIFGAMGASIVLGILSVGGPGCRPSHVLVSTINPNTASRAGLLCLPGIGPVRVQAIMHYRQSLRYSEQTPAFRDPNDLMRVKGIGITIVDQMRPWLSFANRRGQ